MKLLTYSFCAIFIIILLFLYEIYFGENKLSLLLNQGLTDAPSNLSHVTIENRRGLYCIISGYDATTTSSCITTKKDFSTWLQDAKFEVIYYIDKNDSATRYCSSYHSLPPSLLKNELGYAIQIQGGNPKMIFVEPIDEKTIQLEFYSDWN